MGYGADEKGEKMSKSKGNVIDPYPIVQSLWGRYYEILVSH